MGKKCKQEDCPECLPEWLAAFGDLMSLLLCFFVLLLSMATMDAVKVREAIGSFKGTLGILEGSEYMEAEKRFAPPPQQPPQQGDDSGQAKSSMANPVQEINEVVKNDPKESVTIEDAEDGFIVRLPAALPFRKDSASIDNPDAKLFIKRMASVIKKMPNDIKIVVRGHTDDQQPSLASNFKDNWELSSARAIAVVKELIGNGVNRERLSAAGYADTEPITSNFSEEGRLKNSRVEVYFYANNHQNEGSARSQGKPSVLDN
jgi:chemotaxis protein MotB